MAHHRCLGTSAPSQYSGRAPTTQSRSVCGALSPRRGPWCPRQRGRPYPSRGQIGPDGSRGRTCRRCTCCPALRGPRARDTAERTTKMQIWKWSCAIVDIVCVFAFALWIGILFEKDIFGSMKKKGHECQTDERFTSTSFSLESDAVWTFSYCQTTPWSTVYYQ